MELLGVPDVDIEPIHGPRLEPFGHFLRDGFSRTHECTGTQLSAELYGLAQREAFLARLVCNAFGSGKEAAARSLQALLGKRCIEVVLAEIMPAEIAPELLQGELKAVIGLMIVLLDFPSVLVVVMPISGCRRRKTSSRKFARKPG